MKVTRHQRFRKNYKKRILPFSSLDQKFEDRMETFLKDPENPLLNDHKLEGRLKVFRAFSVTGDVRVVYRKIGQEIILYDIGTHNQIY